MMAEGIEATLTQADRMTDQGFLEFLDDRRLTSITGNGPYAVDSQSGQSYTVSLTSSIDRYDVFPRATWHCTCPARKSCRHIDAVVDTRWAEANAAGDYDAMDAMEREVL
jgi:uncharacterized Zn finger protein